MRRTKPREAIKNMKKRKIRQQQRAEQERQRKAMSEHEQIPNEEFPESPELTSEMPEEIPEAEMPAEDAAAPEAAQAELDAAKAQAQEYLNLAQRVQADFDNYRKRNASLRADSLEEGKREVAALMLPVLDNLERALDSAAEDSPLRSGLELTLKQMRETYAKLGAEVIDRQGEKFDPNLENAVMQAPADAGEPGTVAQVFQKGYVMNGHVLRHAMVQVVAE